MEQMVSGISLVTKRKDSRRIIIISTVGLLFVLLLTESLRGGPTPSSGTFILATLGSFLAGINLSLAYTYMDIRKGTLWSAFNWNLSSILSYIKTITHMYGTAIFSVVLGFLGFSTMMRLLPGRGEELGYIGLIILLIATFALAQRLEERPMW